MAKTVSQDRRDIQMEKPKHFQISLNEVDELGTKEFLSSSSLVKDYFESTTTHGLSRVYFARNTYIRSFWLLIFFVVFGFLIAAIYGLIDKATRHDAVTNIQTKLYHGLEFPAITFCNGKPFRESELSKILPEDIAQFHFGRSNNTEMKLALYLSKLNTTDLEKVGHPMKVFLMTEMAGCLFLGGICNFSDFVTITTPIFGNCYTFNPKGRIQKKVDSASGLSVLLNINQNDNTSSFSSWSSTAGVKVMIHHPNEIFPETQAIYLAPGTWTDIKIEKKIIKRLQYPHPDNCSQELTMEKSLGLPVRYTTEMCQYMCYINEQNKICGYTTPLFSSSMESIISQFVPKAKDISLKHKIAENESQIQCLLDFDDSYSRGKVHCNCPPSCHEEQFQITTSNAMWPPLNKAHDFLYYMKERYKNEMTFNNWTRDTLYNNILAANIYFKDFTVETVEQKPAYTMADFASDLGGQMGLWIGASVFSAFELGAFLLSWLTHLLLLKKQMKVNVEML